MMTYKYSFEALEFGNLQMYGEAELNVDFSDHEVTEVTAISFNPNPLLKKPTALDENESSVDFNEEEFTKFIVRDFNWEVAVDTALYNAVLEQLSKECDADRGETEIENTIYDSEQLIKTRS